MSERKKTCGNCVGRIESILSKDRCDMTRNTIENYSNTCNHWEPNRETEIVMQKDELKSLRQERDSLQEQVAEARQETINVREHWFKKYQQSCSSESVLSINIFVLRGALKRLTETIDDQIPLGGYCEEIGLNIDVMFEPWASLFDAKERADAALLLTPVEAFKRVQKLVEALEAIDKTGKLFEADSIVDLSAEIASKALSEWRRDK